MNKYTFFFSDGVKDSIIAESQDAAWKKLGFDHSMIGFLKYAHTEPIDPPTKQKYNKGEKHV